MSLVAPRQLRVDVGFTPKFGIVAVDLATQRRTIKPSGAMLGNIARRNSL